MTRQWALPQLMDGVSQNPGVKGTRLGHRDKSSTYQRGFDLGPLVLGGPFRLRRYFQYVRHRVLSFRALEISSHTVGSRFLGNIEFIETSTKVLLHSDQIIIRVPVWYLLNLG